ncbi:protein FAR-RED IMPAIRED RESPONSE 1-like [Arachis hypogaea]|uniref:Protein FAR-RED IMPAIRED RESPONSE 1-like n=1 Tax=Arachis hypogaea TaxID=3818 RepID=A0A6B9V5Q6_ARAHY|nr:protein FAR-RED IMPAIRED RESPONSE 1-like [Arachis hypogaea]
MVIRCLMLLTRYHLILQLPMFLVNAIFLSQRKSYAAYSFSHGLERVKKLPNKYILDRWKKTLKRKHSSIKCSHDPSRLEPVKKRYDDMCKQFYDIAEVTAASEELIETVHRILDSVWVMLVEPKASSMDNVDNQNSNEVDENANDLEIHNPQQVSRKGRRRKKRFQSTVEKFVKQGRKKYKKNVKERSQASSVLD